jgi:hypothetical protein
MAFLWWLCGSPLVRVTQAGPKRDGRWPCRVFSLGCLCRPGPLCSRHTSQPRGTRDRMYSKARLTPSSVQPDNVTVSAIIREPDLVVGPPVTACRLGKIACTSGKQYSCRSPVGEVMTRCTCAKRMLTALAGASCRHDRSHVRGSRRVCTPGMPVTCSLMLYVRACELPAHAASVSAFGMVYGRCCEFCDHVSHKKGRSCRLKQHWEAVANRISGVDAASCLSPRRASFASCHRKHDHIAQATLERKKNGVFAPKKVDTLMALSVWPYLTLPNY